MIRLSDRLQSALEKLVAIVGAANSRWPSDANFDRYMSDETYLRGSASLILTPRTQAEAQALVREMNALREALPGEKAHLSFTLRGAGSGLSGAAVPREGIVLDLSALDRVLEIDERNQTFRAESGLVLGRINDSLVGTGLWYPVDPSSLSICTLGGSIATNAAGPSSLKYGTTRQNLSSVRWLGAGGELISAGSGPVKTSMGFSLADLLCGSEGRLGLILDATVRLATEPPDTALLLAAFADEQSAVETIIKIRRSGIKPRCIEMLDAFSMQLAKFPVGKAGALLMIELDGENNELTAALDKLQNLQKSVEWIAARDENSRRGLWAKRQSITLELKKRYPFKLGEDIAVPIASLATTVQAARAQAAARGIETAIWGHAGDGNLHVNYLLESENQLPQLEPLMLELAREATRVGGAMSGEHGLGRLKRKIARSILAPEYFSAQSSIKQAFDPLGIFNPALEE